MEQQRVLSDRYALISHLARGGMADVFVGRDQLLDRQVAVKVLHGEFAANDAFVERFRREAQSAANLSHPNIVSIYDWGRDRGVYYMVMELIEGRNLRDVLRSEGALLPRRVAEIGIEVAAALSAAHERGLVHRDIKPANVLLTSDGSVKVTDFGIARAWDDSEQLTRTGAVIGTATYFSPEQAQGHTADGRSDLYSLGVVMYELLTGSPPFSGESPVAVAYQHVREEAPHPSQLNPSIPDALNAVVMACLSKDPDHRYQTAEELSDDLQRVLAGQMPAAAPQNEAPTVLMPAADPGLVAPPVVPPASPPGVPPADQFSEPAFEEPHRPDRTTLIIGILAGVAVLGLGLILLLRVLWPSGSSSEEVTIPDLRLDAQAEAVAELEGLGFEVEIRQVPDAEVPAGQVTRTDPEAGETAKSGATIDLYVSTGAGTVDVPRLTNATEAQARALIEQAGLTVGEITQEASDTVEQGRIISQDPEPDTEVPAGTEVDLVISAGTEVLTVPDLTGRSESDALRQLADEGFAPDQIRVERQPSGEVLEGFVIETDPPAGATIAADGTIELIISEGAVPTVVPDVIGMEPESARVLLEDLGFVVEFGDPVDLEFDDENDGKVAEQDHAGGVTLDYGSTITLRVGTAADVIPIPDVIGATPEDARTTIEGAGLGYTRGEDVLLDPDTEADQVGTVVAVSPNVGTQVDPGSLVIVQVGVAGAKVPDVVSTCLSPEDARAAIEGAGLIYEEVGIDDTLPVGDACDGMVVEQSPGPYSNTNRLIAQGSSVQVRVGQAMVLVPDVTGMAAPAARQAVRDAGLTPVDGGCLVDAANVDRVSDQIAGAGAAVPRGSTVELYFGIANEGDTCNFGT